MNKIGLNWSTLEYKTKKSLVLIISRIYKRLSPVLLLDTIISLSEINCTPDEIEKISKDLKIEFYLLNANDNKDTDLNIMRNVDNNNNSISSSNSPLSVHGIKSVLTIQGNDNIISQKEDLTTDSNNILKIEDNYIESDDNQLYNENEKNRKSTTITTKKRNFPLFISFEKSDFFDLISNYISLGTYNNWELVQLLSCLSKLGNSDFNFNENECF